VTDRAPIISVPSPLSAQHDLEDFRSGETILDDWLRQRALANMDMAASKTYVVCSCGSFKVIGYYALAMGHILNRETTGAMRRNIPQHIPAVILGRLAVDLNWQGTGIGPALLADAVRRSRLAAEHVSARLLIVHAMSPKAEAFYDNYGFTRLPVDAPTLALDLLKFSRMPAA
jgi:GNAT superfamily N-acetyltransferase